MSALLPIYASSDLGRELPDLAEPLPEAAAPDEESASVTPAAAAAPPPCYFWNVCAERAAMEKAGRSVCVRCSAHLRGTQYPLRAPSLKPLYASGRAAAEAMNLIGE